MDASFWTEPWSFPTTIWLVLSAFAISLACGFPGTFLVLRRMSFTGDAISHSVLPGIVLGFLVSGALDSPWIVVGAASSGWASVMVIDLASRRGAIREDVATGVVFSAMFSIGVVLMRLFAAKIDLDPDCVLFGSLETAVHGARSSVFGVDVPNIVLITTGAAAVAVCLVLMLYHRLLITSFDPMLSRLSGQIPAVAHSLLLGVVAMVVVAAFQCVGAIMAVALLIVPAASSLLLWKRLPAVLGGVCLHSALSSVSGLYLATWVECNLGAAVILSGAALFVVALGARSLFER